MQLQLQLHLLYLFLVLQLPHADLKKLLSQSVSMADDANQTLKVLSQFCSLVDVSLLL